MTLDVAVKDGITGPLGMDATTFLRNPEQAANTTPIHVKGTDGTWTTSAANLVEEPEYWAGGHGLYSTPTRLHQVPAGATRWRRARRCPHPDPVQRRRRVHQSDRRPGLPGGDRDRRPSVDVHVRGRPGYKWGYGLLLNTSDIPGMRRAYSGAWAGLFNTHSWVDRASGVCGSIYSNFLPFGPPEALELYANSERAVYTSR